MVKTIILCCVMTLAAIAQTSRSPDNPQTVRTGQSTRPVGAGVCWDQWGLLTSVGCTGSGSGEVNTGSNLGTGAGVFSAKSGVDLRFRSLIAGSNRLNVTQGTNEITFDILPANITLSSLGGLLGMAQINASGTPSSSTYLRGDGVWATIPGGGGGGPANTDALAEGTTNLYFTTSRARGAIGSTGVITYNSSTGIIGCATCVSTSSSYGDPAWISGLAWSKIVGAPAFEVSTNRGIANGYAALGATGLVPAAQLGTGTANSTVFLRGDGTWTNPSGSVNALLNGTSVGTRPGMNFSGNVTVTDDGPNNRVNVAISGYNTIKVNGTSQTARNSVNHIASPGIIITPTDNNPDTDLLFAPDPAVIPTRARVTQGDDATCIPASGSGTAYTCVPASGTSYPTPIVNGARIMFRPDVNCGLNPTLNISSIGAHRLFAPDGTSSPSCTAGLSYWLIRNNALDGGAGGWVFPAGGTAVSALPPYLSLAGVLYLPGMYQATLPPTAGGGGWTVRGGSGTPTLATTPNGALTLTPDAGGTAGNYQWQARTIGTTRQLTVVLAANVRGNSVCSVGTARNGSGFPLAVTLTDNRNAGPAAVQSQAQFNGTTYQFVGGGGTASQFTPDTPAYIRINITGSDVLIQRSMDYGLTWTTAWSRTQSDTFGGAVANTDQWMIGGVFQTGQVPVCTILSWEAI